MTYNPNTGMFPSSSDRIKQLEDWADSKEKEANELTSKGDGRFTIPEAIHIVWLRIRVEEVRWQAVHEQSWGFAFSMQEKHKHSTQRSKWRRKLRRLLDRLANTTEDEPCK